VRQMRDTRSIANETRHQSELGQTMAEYAVVLGVITLAIVGVFAGLSGGIGAAVSVTVGLV
jgi:Flp pilus assembly pilin Flp